MADTIPDLKQLFLAFEVQTAASWLNTMLYMLELVMVIRYFRRASRPLPHRIGVAALVFFDTACTMALDANVIVVFLSFFGKQSLGSLFVPTTVILFMTYLSASVEQLFLCHLYFILTRNRLICVFLTFLVILHLAFSFASGILLQTSAFGDPRPFTANTIGASLCAVTDVSISALLGWEFFKIKSRHNTAQDLIRRIYILCVTSGAIVASTTILMLILFLKGAVAFQFFFSCQGRVYALTLLANFLSRPSASSSTPAPSMRTGPLKMQSSLVFRTDTRSSGYSSVNEKALPPIPASPAAPTTTTTIQFAHFCSFSASDHVIHFAA
ncbi:hypothetical protein FB45DRAFT_279352 [Roridomyces roridus]|uniref:DUF6534 domain-containing protein n=1 Tax=Roridomyces roridus TaxID=1738132 RepID=A0AAD7CAV3_9AGAR|nr:hypothetical protein FB45DRAFT_279352 [Roridomyces roridus]